MASAYRVYARKLHGADISILRRRAMLSTILLIFLILILLGALPAWPYSRSWGYYPSGAASIVLVVVVVLLLAGRI